MNDLRLQLASGEVLFREGDRPGFAFLIESGSLEVRTRQRPGETEVVLSVLGPGDLVGEMAAIDESPRTATATAITDCVLFPISRQQIAERLAGTDPIVRSLLQGQLKRYRGALAALQGQARSPEVASSFEREGIDKIRLEAQLREALALRTLDVSFQPLRRLATGEVAGYEALVRWTHPERGVISPAQFVALAEETSLIVAFGEYVMDVACEAVAALMRAGAEPPPFIAVNVSARQLAHPGLVERIVARADAARLPRGSIKLEITESQALDYDLVGGVIAICHGHGIEVALDDFGTGLSNLSHLHRLPFDTIKLDQSFSRGLLEDPRARVIVEAVIGLGSALGAQVVAEGVETPGQLEALRAMGCHFAQGYLIGRPQRLEALLSATGQASPLV
jgi:EAL domain-containing protein (putative c-di-GMP-specific phosphodiesterase class I)